MKIALLGSGKMGKAVEKRALEQGVEITSLEKADVWIDFSHASCVIDHLDQALSLKKPIVIGTTGWNEQIESAKKKVIEQGGSALFSPNFSFGIALFLELLKKTKTLLEGNFESSGIEMHHKEKKDAPSGTAKAISKVFEEKLPFASVRLGSIVGTHSVIFDNPFETITVTHDAKNREGFAEGALLSARFLKDKKGWYTFDDVFRDLYSTHHSV